MTALAASISSPLSLSQSSVAASRAPLPDITSLDIKNSSVQHRKKSTPEDIDFFQDMEPIIPKPKLLRLEDIETLEVDLVPKPSVSCFDVDVTAVVETDGEGWGDNENWGDSDTDLPVS